MRPGRDSPRPIAALLLCGALVPATGCAPRTCSTQRSGASEGASQGGEHDLPGADGRGPVASRPLGAPDPGAAARQPSPLDDGPEARQARERLVREIEGEPPWGDARWDPRVIDAMRRVPRHQFAPGLDLSSAYHDSPQPIGHGQTISQPTIVALMTNALRLSGAERVLEIGTGSGYQAAVLSLLCGEVMTIEIVEPLGVDARERLARLGYRNVSVRIGDGYQGWPERAPFDRVILTAAPPEIPEALVDQLRPGGILVAPVGESYQELVRWTKVEGGVHRERLGAVRFVPMVPGP